MYMYMLINVHVCRSDTQYYNMYTVHVYCCYMYYVPVMYSICIVHACTCTCNRLDVHVHVIV